MFPSPKVSNKKDMTMTMNRIIVEIEARNWTQEQLDSFHDWLQEELAVGNMATDDDATVLSVRYSSPE